MSTYKKINDILRYTQDARQKAINGYWTASKESMQKAIEIIDSL